MRPANLFHFRTPAGLYGLVLFDAPNVKTIVWTYTPEETKAALRENHPDIFLVSRPITWEQFQKDCLTDPWIPLNRSYFNQAEAL